MRLLFIRHGDPDYENDTVTEKGKREVELLAQRAESLELGHCFVSPLGRAQDTAAPSLARTGKNAETLDWLEEFPAKIDLNKVPHLIKAYLALQYHIYPQNLYVFDNIHTFLISTNFLYVHV